MDLKSVNLVLQNESHVGELVLDYEICVIICVRISDVTTFANPFNASPNYFIAWVNNFSIFKFQIK